MDIRAISIESILLISALLLVLAILASKASSRLGVPALLVFLILGMLAGSDGPGGIYFDDPWLAQLLGSAALVYILFAGGLSTKFDRIRPIILPGIVLSTLGVILTAALLGVFAMWILEISLLEGLLLGSIVSSTDAAAVFSILRTRAIRLKDPLEPILEMESGSNDPMAVLLTVGFTQLLSVPDSSLVDLIPLFIQQILLGIALGYIFGRGLTYLINQIQLDAEGLYPVLTMAFILLIYGVTSVVGGNGFLAVYLAGLILGNSAFIHKRSLMRFHDGIAWLMQIVMFVTLGLLVFPSEVIPIIPVGLLVAAFLMLVARPVAVFLLLHFSRFSFREKTIISWVGLRGAVPIILATFPLISGLAGASLVFNIVFFVVITSVLLQGTSIGTVAQWLKLDTVLPESPNYPIQFELTEKYRGDLVELEVTELSQVAGKRIVDIGLPDGALVVLIHRDDEFIVPKGSYTIRAGDRILILADEKSLTETRFVLNAVMENSPKIG